MLELNKLYNMDCMQGMKEFPDGFFDLAIVDPPYGIGIDGQKKRVCGNPKHNRKEHIRKSWDKAIPPPEYFRELERVSKAQVIWGGNYFVPYLEQGHKGWLVWDKGQHGLTMSDCELAYPVETTFAYYRLIELSATGTLDDPIPYPETAGIVVNVVSGLYYSYKGAVYLAKADMPNCVYPPDTAGLWQWEKVT